MDCMAGTYLEWCSGVGEVKYLDVPLSSADDHQGVLDIHGIAALGELHSRYRSRLAQVPVLRQCWDELRPQYKETRQLTLTVLSQLPVASTLPCGDSIQRTTRIGASCCATWEAWPVVTSNMRPALSAPPERILDPS